MFNDKNALNASALEDINGGGSVSRWLGFKCPECGGRVYSNICNGATSNHCNLTFTMIGNGKGKCQVRDNNGKQSYCDYF